MYGFIQNGNTRTEYYREVGRSATKKGKCLCGKMRTRTQKFSQTINPFNRVTEADGTKRLKTEFEIIEEVKAEIEEWKKDTEITCKDCYALWREKKKQESPTPA